MSVAPDVDGSALPRTATVGLTVTEGEPSTLGAVPSLEHDATKAIMAIITGTARWLRVSLRWRPVGHAVIAGRRLRES